MTGAGLRVLVGVGLIAIGGAAHAFAAPDQFFASAAVTHGATAGASGEGIYFTGAPRFAGLECSKCHTGGPQRISLQLTASDAALFKDGYSPGQTYALMLQLVGEAQGLSYKTPACTEPPIAGDTFPYQQCNNNGFALEIDAAGGPLTGGLCAADSTQGCPVPDVASDEIVVAPQGDAVLANRPHAASSPRQGLRNGPTSWHLWWTAPAAGTGAVRIYAAAVDGNGGAGTAASDQDPYGDDTASLSLVIAERGAPAMPSRGCTFARGGAPGSWLPLALLLLALVAVRRRGAAALVMLWVAASGCDNGPNMTPGQDCMNCHVKGGTARSFTIAGTVFPSAGAGPDHGLAGVIIRVTDASGSTVSLVSNEAGNFYTRSRVQFPVTAEIEIAGQVRHMEPSMTTGSCSSCHDAPPNNGAEGRLFIAPAAPAP